MSPPRVRACIVSYRSGESAAAACRSALDAGAEVVLVDNSPGDGTASRVAREAPDATVVEAPRNLGFGGGSNLAARGAGTDYLLFLNPDARIDAESLALLVSHLDGHPEVGIVGPGLFFPDGRPQPSVRTDPSAAAVLHQYTAWKWTFLLRGAYRRYRSSPPPAGGGPTAVEVLMGSVLLVRRSRFEELGGFDPRYFMYYEEADLCRRMREAGSAVVWVPGARAFHVGGVSARAAPPRLAADRLVSAQRYVVRFSPPAARGLFRVGFVLGFPLRAMFDLVRDLFYAGVYAIRPSRHEKARVKAREALASASLLTAYLFRVIAA